MFYFEVISLVGNNIKKVINRLKRVLYKAIHHIHVALTKGKRLIDDVLVANEVVEETNTYLLKIKKRWLVGQTLIICKKSMPK